MATEIFKSIPTSSGLELISAVLTKTSPPGPTFHTALDDILSSQLAPASHAHSSLSSLSSLARGDLIELSSSAGIGKTQFLYFLCLTTILPFEVYLPLLPAPGAARGSGQQHEQGQQHGQPGQQQAQGQEVPVMLGGRGKSVIFIDLDARFSILTLASHLQAHIKKRLSLTLPPHSPLSHSHSHIPSTAIQQVVQSSLKRVHIFRPTSTLHLAATLQSLPSYQRDHMPEEEMLMLMIDSITAFYWADRAELERSRVAWEGGHPMVQVRRALERLRRERGAVVWVTVQEFFPHRREESGAAQGGSMLHRAGLPEPTHRIILTKPPLEPFPAGTRLAQAKRDEARKEALEDAKVEGRVKGIRFEYGIGPRGLVVGE